MNNEKQMVTVISTVGHEVGISIPELLLRRDWTSKGQKHKIDKETLEQAMFYPGVAYMFNTGMLYIEDMQDKKDLGLEPEDATEPQNIIVLTDAEKDRYLKNVPLAEFRQKMKTLSREQLKDLVEYAVDKENISFDKAEVLMQLTNLDAIKMIQLKRQNNE